MGEQGIGDEIMFAGLIPEAIRTGNRCILDCNSRLKLSSPARFLVSK